MNYYPVGVALDETFYFVINGFLHSVWSSNWNLDFVIGRPDTTLLRTNDNLVLLNKSLFTIGADNHLWEYDTISREWIPHESPSATVPCSFACGASMADNALFVIGSDNNLYRRAYYDNSWNWDSFSKPCSNCYFNEFSMPLRIENGRLFIVASKPHWLGHRIYLYELNFNDPINYVWISHGRPGKNCSFIGASMINQKIFLSTINGKIYERFFNGSSWSWVYHGKIRNNGGFSSVPSKLNDAKFFISTFEGAHDDSTLHERWWDVNLGWNWANHGNPIIGSVEYRTYFGPACMDIYPPRVFLIGEKINNLGLQHLLSRFWNGTNWEWFHHFTI